MAGLYDGVEEVGFKRVAGGFVFQTRNPWLFGPQRRYFVNEAQKTIIAACIRETLRRLKPWVIVAAIVIPLALIGGTLWLALRGATLDVAVTGATGATTSYSQPIDAKGSTVILDGADGAKVFCHVSGFPGKDATLTLTTVNASGKASAPFATRFGPGKSAVNIVDANHRRISSAVLSGRIGATQNAVMLDAALLALAIFGPYFVLVHLYATRRLHPLLVGLPRSRERVTMRDNSQSFASKVSFKLLMVMAVAGAASCLANVGIIVNAMIENHPIFSQPAPWIAIASSALITARVSYFLLLRARLRRQTAAENRPRG